VRHSLLILCIAGLCVILTLGLWPFHAPTNAVTWLKDRNGLRFGASGTVMSSGAFDTAGSPDPRSCSVEVWLQAARAYEAATFLTLYVPNQPVRLSFHQSLSDLELRTGKTRHFYVNDVFRPGRPVFCHHHIRNRGRRSIAMRTCWSWPSVAASQTASPFSTLRNRLCKHGAHRIPPSL